MHLYNLTLQPATAATHAIVGNFSGARQQELIVSRGSRLELLRPDVQTGKVVREFRGLHYSHIFDIKFDCRRIVRCVDLATGEQERC